jgi:UDP-2,4-diacetamido-2,4,6-trideoxy-beta-L-altropyranose hydrolase
MGTGHVMRCLALAQAWQDAGGRAIFAMADSTAGIQARLAAESCKTVSILGAAGTKEDSRETISLAREHNANWVVVDGYQFGADYQQALKSAGLKILFLDDYVHAKHYFADFVLNQNVTADESLYQQKEPQTQLLLGPRYSLLRREFSAWKDWTREVSPVVRRLLVMMGGSDAENLSSRAIEALSLAGLDLETTIVVGGSNPHLATLVGAVTHSGLKIELIRDVTNMAELMARADVALSAAGSTCWELCLLGLPALLVDVAENQTALAKELDRRGCAIHIGSRDVSAAVIVAGLHRLCRDHELRISLSQRSRELVDGNGARRVVSVLRGTEGMRLRRARIEDRRILWEWANDPAVRASSFSSDPISWETHVAWFAEKCAFDEPAESARRSDQNKSLIWIAEDATGTAIGQIRFDFRPDGSCEVDVSIAPSMRGLGLASTVIRLGVQELRKEQSGGRVHALIKSTNVASLKAFEQAGFRRTGTDQIRGYATVHFISE